MRGTYLPSCFGTDLDALLTYGDSPVVAVESLNEAGQQLLHQGLSRPQSAAEADLLGLQTEQLTVGNSSMSAAAARAISSSGVEERVPKEVQRLVTFLRVSFAVLFHGTRQDA